MQTEPTIVERAEQPYVAIRAFVTMQTIGPTMTELLPELFGWLGTRGIDPAGAVFLKYNVIDMERELEIEVGIPVANAVEGDDRVLAGTLPGGSYGTLTHIGHPSTLVGANAALLEWADHKGLAWDISGSGADERWGARLEVYESDPEEEPDLTKWKTEVTFRLAQ